MRKRLLTALMAAVAGWGATLIDVSGPNDPSLAGTVVSNNLAVGFSLPAAYSNVSIASTLLSFGGSGDWNLSAYLTNSIGPGTTATNELASSATVITMAGGPFAPPYALTPHTVFNGLTLAAGDYYLILGGSFNTQNAWWASSQTGNGVVSAFNGASIIAEGLTAGVPDLYLPASLFSSAGVGDGFWFSVSGDVMVPEPGTAIYAFPGFVMIWLLRRRLED